MPYLAMFWYFGSQMSLDQEGKKKFETNFYGIFMSENFHVVLDIFTFEDDFN